MKKKLEILGFLSIIILSGITVQNAFANIEINNVDLVCSGDTELGYTDIIDFLVMCPLFGASPPIITLIGNPAIELLIGFPYVDDGATANDNGDGDLTNSITITGLPVDTSTLDTFFITFDVTDSTGNDAIQIVRTVTTTKREPTANIDITPTTEQLGGVKEVPSLSDVPPLIPSEPIPIQPPPRRTLDEIFDLFSFLFEEVEPIPTLEVIPEPESITDIPAPLFEPTVEPTEVRPSFIESIQNFFTKLFG